MDWEESEGCEVGIPMDRAYLNSFHGSKGNDKEFLQMKDAGVIVRLVGVYRMGFLILP